MGIRRSKALGNSARAELMRFWTKLMIGASKRSRLRRTRWTGAAVRALVTGAASCLLLTSCKPVLERKPNIEGEKLSETPAAAKASPVLKFAENSQGSFACGLYLEGKKIGYIIGTSKIIKRGDTNFFEQKIETLFNASQRGKHFVDKSTLTRLFNLDANGELASVEQVNERDGNTYTSLVSKQGDKFSQTTSGGKSTNTITIEPPTTSLDNDKQLGDWLRSSPKPGDQFDYKSSDFNGGEFNEHTSHYTYVSGKNIVINGVATTVHTLDMKDDRDNETTRYDCDNCGRLLRGTIGPVAFRLEEEGTARNLGKEGIDLIEASSVPTNVRMGDPTKLKQVLLKISGINYTLPNSHRQMRSDDEKNGNWTTIMITRDFKSPDKEPQSKEQLQEYLKSTPSIQSDSKEIQTLAQRTVGNETNVIKKAELLQKAVFDLIGKDVNRNSMTALEVLERKTGDCTEHALLFNALARAAGIPSREVTGLMYTQAPNPTFYWHAWNEIYDGTRWISVDPTWNEVYVDAGHLKIADEDTVKIANSFGKIKIEIVSFQTSGSVPNGAFVEPEKPKADDIVLMDKVPPPPPIARSILKEAPPAVNMSGKANGVDTAHLGEMRGMENEQALNEMARKKPQKKANAGRPIEQFHGSQLHQVQFYKDGRIVE